MEKELSQMKTQSPWVRLLRQLHHDEQGSVSIETLLVVAAIALPVLIFILKFGWPRIKEFFNKGMNDMEAGVNTATSKQ